MKGDELVRGIHRAKYGHLEQRVCTKDAPMPAADKDRYLWSHADAVEVRKFFNVIVCQCPNCGLEFTCFPR